MVYSTASCNMPLHDIPGALPNRLPQNDALQAAVNKIIYSILYIYHGFEFWRRHHHTVQKRASATYAHYFESHSRSSTLCEEPTQPSYDNIPETVKLQHLLIEKNQQIHDLKEQLHIPRHAKSFHWLKRQ